MFFKNGKTEPQSCSLLEISKHFLSIWAPSYHHGDQDTFDPLTFTLIRQKQISNIKTRHSSNSNFVT